ncbi:hypothetical protein ACIQUC_08480 [Curtobacterium sp. NPDC098951]|uniref:hypothetical protein n=1 Tax=Curtobacterium sp. NPDC098951 TaxID=3363974 RepID=UPI00380D6E3F
MSFEFPSSWDRGGLETVGFEGFVTFAEVRLPRVLKLPKDRGVYVVLYEGSERPDFSIDSPAKGAPYPPEVLASAWLEETRVLYIGAADAQGRGIHHRLKQYARRGNSHTGGRAIWQIPDADEELLVAWAESGDEPGVVVEKRLRAEFKRIYGQFPFANWIT